MNINFEEISKFSKEEFENIKKQSLSYSKEEKKEFILNILDYYRAFPFEQEEIILNKKLEYFLLDENFKSTMDEINDDVNEPNADDTKMLTTIINELSDGEWCDISKIGNYLNKNHLDYLYKSYNNLTEYLKFTVPNLKLDIDNNQRRCKI